MKDAKNTLPTKNAYKPSNTLITYLKEKLLLLKLERDRTMRGEGLSDKDQKKKELNQRKRVHVLNRHVFESMANLITFFEFIRSNPGLLEEFHDEIKELLMGVTSSRKTKDTAFYRLIDSMLYWDYDKNIHDFRVVLLNLMQWCVYGKVREISYHVFGATITNKIIQSDLIRAYAWTKALAERKDVDQWVEMEDHHRPVLF